MTEPTTFKKSDIRRAVSAVRQEGLEPTTVEIGADGSIRLSFGTAGQAKNEWDDVLETQAS